MDLRSNDVETAAHLEAEEHEREKPDADDEVVPTRYPYPPAREPEPDDDLPF